MTLRKDFANPRFFALALVVAYPFVVYFFLDDLGPDWLGLLLVVILMVRYRQFWRHRLWLLFPAAIAGLLFVLLEPRQAEQGLRYYPVAISLVLLMVFGASLYYGPSMIERFASATGAAITPSVRLYTRKLTLIWCGFFGFNALVSGTIAKSADMQLWVLYNGMISYVLIGLLFGGELVFRHFYLKKRLQVQPEHTSDQLPHIIASELRGNRAEYSLTVGSDLKWFAGHFPGWPVLPGVVQIDWAIVLAEPLGIKPADFAGIPRVKFMSVITPGLEFTLELEKTSSGLRFKYVSAEGTHSKGSIRFV